VFGMLPARIGPLNVVLAILSPYIQVSLLVGISSAGAV
jgi:hypothetical protein